MSLFNLFRNDQILVYTHETLFVPKTVSMHYDVRFLFNSLLHFSFINFFYFFGEAKIKIFILNQMYYNRPRCLRFHFARDSKMYQFVIIEKIIEDGTTSVKHLLM